MLIDAILLKIIYTQTKKQHFLLKKLIKSLIPFSAISFLAKVVFDHPSKSFLRSLCLGVKNKLLPAKGCRFTRG
jgi:hypothetical protein